MHFPRILQHRPSPRAFDDLEGAQAAAAELTRALDAIYSATSGVPTEALCTQLVAFLESIAALDGRTVKRELDAFADLVDRVILALARGQDQPGRYRRHWDECLTIFDYAALKMVPKHNGVYGRGEHKAYTSWRVDKLLLDSALGAPVGDVRQRQRRLLAKGALFGNRPYGSDVPLTSWERLQVARFSRFEIGEPEAQWKSVKHLVGTVPGVE